MAIVYQRYLGRFQIGADTKDFSVGGNAVSLTAGWYFMSGFTGEGDDNLVEHMQVVIRAIGAPYAAATVTQSATTGKITIALGAAGDIVWTDSDLGVLLGFESATTGGSSYTADHEARYCWWPSKGPSDYPGDIARWWTVRSTSLPYRSADGTTYTTVGNKLYDGTFSYTNLTKEDVIAVDDVDWGRLEHFFSDVIHAGQRFRVFPDRSLNGGADYVTAMWAGEPDEAIGSFREFTDRHVNAYNGLWDVDLSMNKYIA